MAKGSRSVAALSPAAEIVLVLVGDPAERRQLVVHLLRASCTVLVVADGIAPDALLLGGSDGPPGVIISTLRAFTPLASTYVQINTGIDLRPTLILVADPDEDRPALLATLGAHAIIERPIDGWSLQRMVDGALEWRRLRAAHPHVRS